MFYQHSHLEDAYGSCAIFVEYKHVPWLHILHLCCR